MSNHPAYMNHGAQAYARTQASPHYSSSNSASASASAHVYPQASSAGGTMSQHAYANGAYYTQPHGHAAYPGSTVPSMTLPPIQANGYPAQPAYPNGQQQAVYGGTHAANSPYGVPSYNTHSQAPYPSSTTNAAYGRLPSHPSPAPIPVPSSASSPPPTGDRFPCPNCDKTFTRNFDRKRHMEIHVPGAGGSNRCPHCRRDYSRADSLKRHLDNGCDKSPGNA